MDECAGARAPASVEGLEAPYRQSSRGTRAGEAKPGCPRVQTAALARVPAPYRRQDEHRFVDGCVEERVVSEAGRPQALGDDGGRDRERRGVVGGVDEAFRIAERWNVDRR